MERKPQQHTLSIRISDTLRDFLEASKGVIRQRVQRVGLDFRCSQAPPGIGAGR
jgi:hypothetical protein